MSWTIELGPKKKLTQKLKRGIHLSLATLLTNGTNDEDAFVHLIRNGEMSQICSLGLNDIYQCPLDLNFVEGEEIGFINFGSGVAFLHGYFLTMKQNARLQQSHRQGELKWTEEEYLSDDYIENDKSENVAKMNDNREFKKPRL